MLKKRDVPSSNASARIFIIADAARKRRNLAYRAINHVNKTNSPDIKLIKP